MSIDIPRTCNNCRFFPCLRLNCGEICNAHEFEHEKIIKDIEKRKENNYEL